MCNTKMYTKTTTGGESTLPKISLKILVKMDLVIYEDVHREYSIFQTRYKGSNVIEISTKECITEQKKTGESLKSKKRYPNAKTQNMFLNFCANLSSVKFFRT